MAYNTLNKEADMIGQTYLSRRKYLVTKITVQLLAGNRTVIFYAYHF